MRDRQEWQALILGIAIAVLGLACLGSGLALLAWRLTAPEQAVLLPPNLLPTSEHTPTPAALGTPLAPPPLPTGTLHVAILPVSEKPSPTPTATAPASATATAHASHTPAPTSRRPTRTPRTSATPTQAVSLTPTASATPSVTPSATPTITATYPAAVPERIIIDRIDLAAPVVPVGQHALAIGDQIVSQWDVPDQRAAGWHTSSATIGQIGNLVLNGHHNVSGEVFRYLVVLEPGDLVTLEADNRRYHYIVVQTMTLTEQDQPLETRQSNARWILPTDDERVTLITCWPYHANTHRLLVIARPFEDVIPPAGIP